MPPETEDTQATQDAELAAALAGDDGAQPEPKPTPEATPAEGAAEGEGQEGDPPEGEGEGEGDQPKPRPAADRIAEITRLRREAERERDHWREVAQRGGKPAEATPDDGQADEDPEPDPEKYTYGDTDPGFIKDLGAHAARQEFKRLSKEQQRESQAQTVARTYKERAEAFAKDHADFAQAVQADDLNISPVMADAIMTSESGPQVAYHLAKNPDEARRISGLHPLAQFREIGKIEARLAPAAAPPPVKTASDAPEPPRQVRGQGGQFKVAPDTDDFAAFEKAYE